MIVTQAHQKLVYMLKLEDYTSIFSNLTTSIVVLDERLHAIFANSAAEVLIGVSASRLAQTPMLKWLMLNEKEQALLNNALLENQPYTIRETSIITIKGQELVIDYSVSPIQLSGNSCLLLEIQGRDRLLRIEKEEELIERHTTTRNLVRGMAHEVKNPLSGIRGAAQLLERQLANKGLQEYTQVIIDEADRLRDLVDKLLGPRTLPELAAINVHSVLERVHILGIAALHGDIELVRDYDPSIPELQADRSQLIQAVLNILLNAVQSLHENPVERPKITIRTRTKRQVTLGAAKHKLVCLIEVTDNGIGIDQELKNSMFFPMISGRADGSGLGLSIAQSIANQHGGLIECRSEYGQTVFSLWLPLNI
ncbi:MAG: two-component system nitrogen regulation sensor histidine kinase GlnL [Oceanospirillaceae bacterium]|jgi:two-component system nitrogen regulation sensor histidine kinase GlnL